MSVLINFKICDNVSECGGIEKCPTGALFWDEENNKIGINSEKCTGCGICVSECPVGAIKVAKNDEEYGKLKKEIEEDPRRISDLFIERYGAMPVHPDVLIKDSELDDEVNMHTKPLLVELFREDDVMCLRKSVPIRDLIPGKDIVFRKVEVENEYAIAERHGISKFPCLLFFRDGEVAGKIEGYFGDDRKDELEEKMKGLIEMINENCPCTYDCDSHGKCIECKEYHHGRGEKTCCEKQN